MMLLLLIVMAMIVRNPTDRWQLNSAFTSLRDSHAALTPIQGSHEASSKRKHRVTLPSAPTKSTL